MSVFYSFRSTGFPAQSTFPVSCEERLRQSTVFCFRSFRDTPQPSPIVGKHPTKLHLGLANSLFLFITHLKPLHFYQSLEMVTKSWQKIVWHWLFGIFGIPLPVVSWILKPSFIVSSWTTLVLWNLGEMGNPECAISQKLAHFCEFISVSFKMATDLEAHKI